MEVDQPQPASPSTGRKFSNCAKLLICHVQKFQPDPWDQRWFVYQERFFFTLDDGTGSIKCSYWYTQEKRAKFVARRKRPQYDSSDEDSGNEDLDDDGIESDYTLPEDVIQHAKNLERDGRQVRLIGAEDNDYEVVDYFLTDADIDKRQKPLPTFAPRFFRLGDLATVRGQLKIFNGGLELHVKHIIREPDPHAEIAHWIDAKELHERFYSKPLSNEQSTAISVESFKDTLRELLVDSAAASMVCYRITPEACLNHPDIIKKWNPSHAEVVETLNEFCEQGMLFYDAPFGEYVTNSSAAMAQDLYDAIVDESKSPDRKMHGAVFRYVAQRLRQMRMRYGKVQDAGITMALKFLQAEGFIYSGSDDRRWKPLAERPPACRVLYFGEAVT